MDSFLKNTIIPGFIFCLCFFFANSVSAAEMFFEADNQEMAINQTFELRVFINSQQQNVNAIEANVFFPASLLELKEVRDSNSVIIFWVERPKVSPEGKISFSGITPGGYVGDKGRVLSLVFQTKAAGEGIFQVRDSRAYLNDGLGTKIDLSVSNFYFLAAENLTAKPFPELKDVMPPESFRPEIGESPDIFNGRHFVAFATQDKDSGIDGYFVFESPVKKKNIFESEWQPGQSPYLLKDQNLRSYVYVMARDRAGNETVETIPPENPRPWYENYYLWFIIIGIGAYLAFCKSRTLGKLWKKTRKRSKKTWERKKARIYLKKHSV
jgi:hypothetical protein